MNRFDAHMHSVPEHIDPEKTLAQMASVGLSGGAVFSPDPESPVAHGVSFDERMRCLETWMTGYEGRFFPVLWIHPLEHDAIDKVRQAVSQGVMGFKMICDCYYVYDQRPMALLREIAKLGKPVIFHSGILWDGLESSKYNRPVNWEALVNIPNLKFSLAHCPWPWTDECIAMYGKFLNAYATNPDASAEMFFDLTPGTPAIYRKDLITKLLMSGYDTPHNLLFGTDCTANSYNTVWSKQWMDRDEAIMKDVGAGQRLLDHYMGENFLRFMGVTEKNFRHITPVPDNADGWSLDYANKTL